MPAPLSLSLNSHSASLNSCSPSQERLSPLSSTSNSQLTTTVNQATAMHHNHRLAQRLPCKTFAAIARVPKRWHGTAPFRCLEDECDKEDQMKEEAAMVSVRDVIFPPPFCCSRGTVFPVVYPFSLACLPVCYAFVCCFNSFYSSYYRSSA